MGIEPSSLGIAFSNSASQINKIYNAGFLANYFNSTSGGSSSVKEVITSSLTATTVPWETDALSVIGSTILFGLGLWSKQKFAKSLQK